MKKLLIDLDDVIVGGGFLYLVNQFLGTNYELANIQHYYIQDLVPDEKKEAFTEYFFQHNFYEVATIYDKAIETVEKLNTQYELYICSAYSMKDAEEHLGLVLKFKYEFLNKYFPFLDSNQFLFVNRKHLIPCDIRIDDKVENLLGECDTRLLYHNYHNGEITNEELATHDITRVMNWDEIAKILLK